MLPGGQGQGGRAVGGERGRRHAATQGGLLCGPPV